MSGKYNTGVIMSTPMTADTFLSILKAEGLVVKEHAGWKTHERDSATGKTFGPVYGIMFHHTASHNSFDVIWNGRSGLPGPLAHAYVDKEGVVWLTSAGRANHGGGGSPAVLAAVKAQSYGDTPPATHYHEGSAGAADGNDAFYGFECENLGDGHDEWPATQTTAMVKIAVAIAHHYGWNAKSVIAHLEWSDWKSDPRGISMKTFRSQVQKGLDAKKVVKPTVPKPTPVYAPFPGTSFFKLGKEHDIITEMGKALKRAGYKADYTPTKKFTRADIKAYAWWQKKLGYSGSGADGYPGKTSWDKLHVSKA
jgi:hypothetical protein